MNLRDCRIPWVVSGLSLALAAGILAAPRMRRPVPNGDVVLITRRLTAVRCSGRDRDGRRCGNATVDPSGYCAVHRGQGK